MTLRGSAASALAFARELVLRHSPLPGADARPRSRVGVLARAVVQILALAMFVSLVQKTFRPLFAERRPPPIVLSSGDKAFELDEKLRKDIFQELAAAELVERKRAIDQNTWNGHVWSREDDRGWQERVLARSIAARHKISLSQVFLVLDEGIRKQWPGPDGKPLPATVPPLSLRPTW